MTQTTGVGSSGGASNTSNGTKPSTSDAMQNLNLDHFLKLMIAELQNQDPLNPMDNSQMLEQIGQMREIGSTDRLTSTLDSVLLGQNVSSATSLIGKHVQALDDKGTKVEGKVDRVTIIDGSPKLHIGDTQVKLSNVGEVRAAAAGS